MKKLLALVLSMIFIFALAGCGQDDAAATDQNEPIKMGRVDYAAHGTRSFTVAVAAVQGDTIVGASIDDYQFMSTDVATGVPNSDVLEEGGLGTNYADPTVVLGSKRANTDYYSEHMKEAGGSTVAIDKNYDAIEEYVVGKTIADLEDLTNKSAEDAVDAVSGATLADTQGYLKAIIAAAKAAQ